MELLPNLHWIEGRISNIYLWLGDNGMILVDTGQPKDAGRILDYVSQLGRKLSEVVAILITHADQDHAGSAAVIHAETNAIVCCGPETAQLLITGESPKHAPWPVQLIMDRFFRYQPVSKEAIRVVADGEMIFDAGDWQALATPGHSQDHFAFYSNVNGVLFAGDALNTRGGRLKSSPSRFSDDLEMAHQSAMRLLRLTPALWTCGHGKPLASIDADQVMFLYHQLQGDWTE
jgi:glyoxylase-like metal-dependent hydrolase (beta-lactamase superfamily II)